MSEKVLFWFRNDLRLHDNVALAKACEVGQVLPVYVFDDALKGESFNGLKKMGPHRWNFLNEAVQDLQENLKKKGIDLYIAHGNTVEIIPSLAQEWGCSAVYCSKEVSQDDANVEASLSKNLKPENIDIELIWNSTLVHVLDLPFPISKLPLVFTDFKNELKAKWKIRETIENPFGSGLGQSESTAKAEFELKGGETYALKHLNSYLFENKAIAHYKKTRNALMGAENSSKFSAWLALGSLSARHIYHEIKKFEQKYGANESTEWLVFELLWRDYFYFLTLKFGTRIFKEPGLKNLRNFKGLRDDVGFEKWKTGNTGVPIVDAAMKELVATGFTSNRARQIVASYLVHNMGISWPWGAAFFESTLIDYDPQVNWGNWNYVAGVGTDPRPNRVFNPYKQALEYDPEAVFQKTWLPDLKNLSIEQIQLQNKTD